MSSIVQEFHERHGPDYIQVEGWLLWPNGAYRESSPYGILVEPDPDPRKRAERIAVYWSKRLDQAVTRFDEKKYQLRMAAHAAVKDGAVPPPEAELTALAELKKEVEYCRKQSEKAEGAAEKAVPEDVRERREMLNRNRNAGNEFSEKLAKIIV